MQFVVWSTLFFVTLTQAGGLTPLQPPLISSFYLPTFPPSYHPTILPLNLSTSRPLHKCTSPTSLRPSRRHPPLPSSLYLSLPLAAFPYDCSPFFTIHHLSLPFSTFPFLSLSFPTFPCLYLTFPPFPTFPYISLPYLGCHAFSIFSLPLPVPFPNTTYMFPTFSVYFTFFSLHFPDMFPAFLLQILHLSRSEHFHYFSF